MIEEITAPKQYRAKCDKCEALGPEALNEEAARIFALNRDWVFDGSQNCICHKCAKIREATHPTGQPQS